MSNCSRNCIPTPLQDLGLWANASLFASVRIRVQQVSCATPNDCRIVYTRCLQRSLSRPDGVYGLPKNSVIGSLIPCVLQRRWEVKRSRFQVATEASLTMSSTMRAQTTSPKSLSEKRAGHGGLKYSTGPSCMILYGDPAISASM